ncbi:Hypothetical predicted protein [Podarcis lilfordi]|uniref:Uncharacterized protein n=1 Tax=Podarcis lilfordi TaxID=74358 RepID=A0AA35KET3_9SAUR|nr:Hypothetical predicted protein [Podarcis lilfordi]
MCEDDAGCVGKRPKSSFWVSSRTLLGSLKQHPLLIVVITRKQGGEDKLGRILRSLRLGLLEEEEEETGCLAPERKNISSAVRGDVRLLLVG